MIPKIIAISAWMMVLAAIFLGFMYLYNPDSWNWQTFRLGKVAESTDQPAPALVDNPGQDEFTVNLTRLASTAPPELSEPSLNGACIRTPAEPVSNATDNPIYRWTDENGVISFGDMPPDTGDYELYNPGTSGTPDYFHLNVDLRNQVVIPFFQRKVGANVTSMYKILSGLIGEENLRQVRLNVVIFPDRPQYLDYSAQVTGERLSSTDGFYTTATNEAITYRQNDDDRTLAVTQHESLHVIIRGIFGRAPHWLNEGLAEYFEQLTVTGNVTRVDPNRQWLALAANALSLGYPGRLADFLNMPRKEWSSDYQNVNYALGWSLVYFLMSSNEGRFALGSLLEELAINYCDSVDSYVLLARYYPGGVVRFERDYRQWISDVGEKHAHIY